MRSGRGAQAIRHLYRTGYAGGEADTVVGPRHVVVHRLRYGDDFHAFLVEPHAIAQRVVAADGDQVIDPEPLQVLQHLGGDIVLFGVVLRLQVWRNSALADFAAVGTRGVEEGAACAPGSVS